MTFPTNPTNGQAVTLNGVEYTYNSTKTAWLKTTAGSGTVPATVSGTLTVTSNITGGNLITGGTLTVTGNANVGNLGTASITTTGNIIANSLVRITRGDAISEGGQVDFQKHDGSYDGMIDRFSGHFRYYLGTANDKHIFYTTGSERLTIDDSNITMARNTIPSATNTYDLGSTSARWRNIYTQDLHLSNGIGDYTVIEGEENLYLVNNKTGKSFKFALIEVDPQEVPPKSKSS